uniref:Uncharacterized protein n=1 Tax=Candidatus Kentrum sp. FM TaxID=2126340 RepID=A0A450SXP6_9GAMM|nr:MAG: hypothetical protein BECKFM1743A_GA0114220_102233 [Candidatus Kentron sp. FM]VFK11874.1 MAG: hypothetical protein BECKFM1743B_GA0114221_102131 [Candidatus Kentron sp. FM]
MLNAIIYIIFYILIAFTLFQLITVPTSGSVKYLYWLCVLSFLYLLWDSSSKKSLKESKLYSPNYVFCNSMPLLIFVVIGVCYYFFRTLS